MPFKNLAIHRDLEIIAEPEDIIKFAKEREEIRIRKEAGLQQPWTKDKTLQIGRFLNVFREDDKTSKIIYKNAEILEGYRRWRAIFIGRWINRVDRLTQIYPLKDDFKTQIEETFDQKKAFTNSTAYQLHSGVGKIFGVKGAKDATRHLDLKMQDTFAAMIESKSLKEATEKVNEAFGGYISFMAYQCAIDWAYISDNEDLKKSDIYEGIGASATNKALGMDATQLADYINNTWEEKKRNLYPFDAENLMCEFRKYHKRKQYGFQSATSKYRENFLGV